MCPCLCVSSTGQDSSWKHRMARHARAMRGIFILTLTTFFFIALSSMTGTPTLDTFRLSITAATATLGIGHRSPAVEVFNNVSTVDLTEIVTELYEHNLTCHQYYTDYRSGSGNVTLQRSNSASLVLYQPPCPLADLSDFRFLINRDLCGEGDVYMLVLVGSHPSNRQIRDVYRQTLGHPGMDGLPFKLVFIFGHLVNVSEQRLLEEEGKKYGDLIQGSFVDSYHNVTLRDLMGLRWAWQYCPQARFVMRMDDDVSVNIYGLVDAIERRYNQLLMTVGCFQMLVQTSVLRTGHYAVSREEHPSDIYDPYCQGWMYMLTPQVAYNLDVASLRVKPYWMNDAYITGTLVRALGRSPLDLLVNYTINNSELRHSRDSWPPKYVVGPTGVDVNLTLTLHHHYKKYAQSQNLPKFKWTNTQSHNSTNRTSMLTKQSTPLRQNLTTL